MAGDVQEMAGDPLDTFLYIISTYISRKKNEISLPHN